MVIITHDCLDPFNWSSNTDLRLLSQIQQDAIVVKP